MEEKIARKMPTMPSFKKIILVVAALAAQQAGPVSADPPAPPLSSRPLTQLKMLQTLFYEASKSMQYFDAQSQATAKMADVAAGTEPPMERGAELGEMVSNIFNDFTVILGDFFDCLDFQIVGLCYRISWPEGISFDIYRQYRLPVQDVENVQHPGTSGFIPKLLNKPILDVTETTYYPFAKDIATTSLMWSTQAAKLQAGFRGQDLGDVPGGLEGDDNAEDAVKQVEKKKRWHNMDPVDQGRVYNEYTVLPQIFNQIIGHLWFFCHDVLTPMIWSSYWPLQILPARMSIFSFLLFPAEMINKFIIANNCAGKNALNGQTPIDMLWTGNTAYDVMNLVSPGAGCQGINQNNWVPVTNITNQSYHTSAAAVGFRKGLATAHGLMPFTFYGFDPERDRVQWSQNDRMPKQCQKLEKFVHDYNGANLKKDKDHWNVGIHWRFFRCCRHGYNILFGPSPMIYQ